MKINSIAKIEDENDNLYYHKMKQVEKKQNR